MISLKNKYWRQAAIWLACVYASIPVVRPLCEALRRLTHFSLLINIFLFGFLGMIVASFFKSKKLSLGAYLLVFSVVVSYVFGLSIIRIPEERIHFLQYGLLAFFIQRAIRPDIKGDTAYLGTWVIVSLLGWLDEGIQHLVPGRYYDIRDVVLNSVSGLMALSLDFIYRRFIHSKKG
ncbi:MAG: VanZ family protein [Candidatus Omnitrophota bacterium]